MRGGNEKRGQECRLAYRGTAPLAKRCFRGALSAEPKPADDRPVASYVLSYEISQETAALPDQLQKTSARGVVFVVPAEVIGKAANTLGEKCYLHFRGAGVSRLRLVLSDDALLGSCVQHIPSRGT